MHNEPDLRTYLIPQPFERALKALRKAFAANNINIGMEVDVASRVEQDLQIGFIPCRILLVDCTSLMVEAATLDCVAAVLFPLHVGITDHGSHTLVHWIHCGALCAGLPEGSMEPLARLESLVARALDTIGVRRDMFEPEPAHAE